MELIVLPGIGNSGPQHWQSLWQNQHPDWIRLAPSSWETPQLDDWMHALERAIAQAKDRPLLLAHSLACLLVVHWAARTPDAAQKISGAMLVAAPDPDSAIFPAAAASFRHVPDQSLPFPAMLVASSDDPYSDIRLAQRKAAVWGCEFVAAGAIGHINAGSHLGEWQQGYSLLSRCLNRDIVATPV